MYYCRLLCNLELLVIVNTVSLWQCNTIQRIKKHSIRNYSTSNYTKIFKPLESILNGFDNKTRNIS